jgi:hypothetical protein
MTQFSDNPFEEQLELVATIAGRAIDASLAERQIQNELTEILRQAIANGIDINELSNATGLTPEGIQRRIEADPAFFVTN